MTDSRIWTTTTGGDWEHGLPAGNGRLGALIYGDPSLHTIVLAHERVVLPTDPPRQAPYLAEDLPLIRSFINRGHAQQAADLGVERAREQGYPALQWTDPLVPSVAIGIETCDSTANGYSRTVDLDRDYVSITWSAAGTRRSIEMFVSRADGVLVARLIGFPPTVRISSAAPQNAATTSSGVKGGNADRVEFSQSARGGDEWLSLRFRADWELHLLGSDSVTTTFEVDDHQTLIVAAVFPIFAETAAASDHWGDFAHSLPQDYDELLQRHLRARNREVHTVALDLSAPRSSRPTEDLLKDVTDGARNRLLELQYLSAQRLIASSTGELPPTLQGVWSGTFDPAWSSDYTMNGNVQSGSIASMLSLGNPSQLRTYLDMLEGFTADFRENAERLFGTAGFVLPSRCSPTHGKCTHFDEQHCHEFWTAGGAWAALFFFDYAWYTADLDYLRDHAYPFAREVERFYEGFLTRDASGHLEFSPSYSPENRSPTFSSQACRNATMDRAALAGLLRGLQRAASILGIDRALAMRRQHWLDWLPPYRVAPDGTLAEWLDDDVTENLGHRTSSHLLGTWFEPDSDLVTRLREPIRALIAAKLQWRASGANREEMAYGLTQLGIAAASIGESELAIECVDRMSHQYFLPSGSTTHDVGAIFNVDIAGGLPEVVNSMLLSSTIDSIVLLPALPQRWTSGSVCGLRARGGVVVDELTWTAHTLLMRARTTSGARQMRGGRALSVVLPVGWTMDSRQVELEENRWVSDVDDAMSFTIQANR